MKIALDLDEVTADFLGALLKYYHEKKGKLHYKEEFTEYKWWPVWGMTREDAVKLVDEFHESHKIEDIKPIEFSVDSIRKIIDNGDKIYVITARPKRFKNKVESWLNHYIKKDDIKVIHSGDFHVGQAATKSDICKEMNINIILEDSGETALDCANNGINVILFDKPWNKNFYHQKITRVNNWKEAINEIYK